MSDSSNHNEGLSLRLRQDMNPEYRGHIAPAKPKFEAEDIFESPAPRAAPQAALPLEGEKFTTQVETAPQISQVRDWRQNYLAWLAGFLILPPSIFWLASLLYTFGVKSLLLKIVTTLPFLGLVVANVVLPVLSIGLALYMLWRTESGDSGRWLAKISLVLSIICLLSLLWWLIDEIL